MPGLLVAPIALFPDGIKVQIAHFDGTLLALRFLEFF
jgi:hypothetical protein